MSYLEELLPEFRKGAKIRCKGWNSAEYIYFDNKGSPITMNLLRKYLMSMIKC